MNEFLAQNMNELVTVVTQLLKNGTQLANEQLPELLKQIIQYKMIDIKYSFYLTIFFLFLSLLALVIIAIGSCDAEDFIVSAIVPTIGILVCIVILFLLNIQYQQCIQTPMAVILETIKFI